MLDAAVVIASGFAREIILTEEEKKDLRFGNFRKAPVTPKPEWCIGKSPYTGVLLLVRKLGAECCYFDSPPPRSVWPDCPKDLAEEFAARKAQARE